MRLRFDLVKNDLKKGLRPVYLITGDEPLQIMQSEDLIRAAARANGYSQREVFHVERGFDWNSILLSANSMSLFAEKKIIELRLNSAKLGDAGNKVMLQYCQSLSSDNLLMVSMPKVDAAIQKTRWFKQVDEVGAVLQIWPIEPDKLPHWIKQQMINRGINPTPEAVRLICDKVEGNLLAASQEIEKLALNGPREIGVEDILEAVADDAKYDVFKLVDAVMLGNLSRAARILRGLKASGEEPVVILWALTREIRSMVLMAGEKNLGIPIGQVYKKYRVWDKRIPIVQSGLSRHSEVKWSLLLQRAIQVDKIIKGVEKGNPWDELLDLGFSMASK